MNLMPFDVLNNVKTMIENNQSEKDGKKVIENIDVIEDSVLDLMIIAYMLGIDDVNGSVGTHVEPDETEMMQEINRKYNGLDFSADIKKYADEGNASGLKLVADTSMHRLYTAGQYSAARRGGVARYKTWETMMDEKVRDQHYYLQGIKIPVDADFYTYTGSKAKYPGGFNDPENDCNCRCVLSFSRE